MSQKSHTPPNKTRTPRYRLPMLRLKMPLSFTAQFLDQFAANKLSNKEQPNQPTVTNKQFHRVNDQFWR